MTTWLIKISLIILIWIFLKQELIHARTSYDCIFSSIFLVSNIYQKKGWKIDIRWKSYPYRISYWLRSIYIIKYCCRYKVSSHDCDNLRHQRIWGQVVSSYWFCKEPGVFILVWRVHFQPRASPGNNLGKINTFQVLKCRGLKCPQLNWILLFNVEDI